MDFLDALFNKNSFNEKGNLNFNPLEQTKGITNIDNQGLFINLFQNIKNKEYSKLNPSNIPLDEIPKRIEKLARLNDTTRARLNKIENLLAMGIETAKSLDENQKNNLVLQAVLKEIQELKKRKVLFIGAENKGKSKINIEKEYKFLKKLAKDSKIGLKRAKPASLENIFKVWDDYRPSIVFFSCHGKETSLFLEDDDGNSKEVTAIELKRFFFERSEYTECVILSACSSSKIGMELKNSCKNIIATTEDVDIKTTRTFTDNLLGYIERNNDELGIIYENAFNDSISLIQGLGLPNSYSFEFYKADKKK